MTKREIRQRVKHDKLVMRRFALSGWKSKHNVCVGISQFFDTVTPVKGLKQTDQMVKDWRKV